MDALLVAVQWVLLLLLVGALLALVSLPFRRRTARPARDAAATDGATDVVTDAPGDVPEWWRCNVCGLRWRSHGVTHVSTLGLKVRRSVRRRARGDRRPTPAWASPRGTERCPSCLSRSIRPSRQQR